MCGICGIYNFSNKPVNNSLIHKMVSKIKKRGPDNTGIWGLSNVSLGHTRLEVIDISYKSHQPMVDMELGLSIVFNGCIYNYKKIRIKLVNIGYRFFSNGDTEVILKAWHAWGKKCVEFFNGDFSFVIFSIVGKELHLVRDRMGIKPLYYTLNNERIAFSSSLLSLLAIPDVNKDIDKESLNHYFSLHGIVPAPNTILKSIKKIPAASIVSFNVNGKQDDYIYWSINSLSYKEDDKSDLEWSSLLEDSLIKSVERRLEADVPVSVLLSGGLDSSLIVALLSKLKRTPTKTYSIGFESHRKKMGDEFNYSDYISKKYNTRHKKIMVSDENLYCALWSTVEAMSEPMVSYDNIAFYLLAKEVSKKNKVVLSGQGADELLGGYHWHQKEYTSEHIVSEYMANFFDRDTTKLLSLLNKSWQFKNKNVSEDYIYKYFNKINYDPVDMIFSLDSEIMLVEDPVKRIDNMMMSWGVEARVPFLDHNFVELAMRLPSRLKLKNNGKGILKDIAFKYLNKDFVNRKKGYFPVPSLKYLDGIFLNFAKEILSSDLAKDRFIYNDNYIQKLLKEPGKYITNVGGSELWQIVILEMWLQKNI